MRTAAVVVIGDEILGGRVRDENSPWLARRLRELGLRLVRITVVPDDVAAIAEAVRRASEIADHVFTTGGVGPTHDDRTMAGVARAFGLRLVRDDELYAFFRRRLPDRPEWSVEHMARVPEGAELWRDPGAWLPLVVVRNVHVLPGVPELLRAGFDAAAHRFAGRPLPPPRRIRTRCHELDIAPALARIQAAHPEARIGSYPSRDADGRWSLLLTVEADDPAEADRVEAELRALVGEE